MTDLSSRAMLVSLARRQWGGERTDRAISAELTTVKGATKRSARVVKSLLPAEALGGIQRASGAAKRLHYSYTLPWRDEGPRILRSAVYSEYIAEIRDARNATLKEEEEFYSKYDVFKAEGMKELGDMVNEDDYPSLEQIRKMFSFELDVGPLPMGGDFRCPIPGADSLKQAIDQSTQDAARAGMKAKLAEAAGLIEHMAEKMVSYAPGTEGRRASGTFRDSLVENVRDLGRMLPKLNLFDDPEIDKLAADITRTLGSYHPEELRQSATNRQAVKVEADDILERLAGYL